MNISLFFFSVLNGYNMARLLFLFTITFSLLNVVCAQQYGSIKDSRDGKVYKTVKIGNQVWMAENLNTDKFKNVT
jgi:hypothetical protein